MRPQYIYISAQYLTVIGGRNTSPSILSEIEVVKISDEGALSSSNCHLTELEVVHAQISNRMICNGDCHGTTDLCKELNQNSFEWEELSQMKKERCWYSMTTANNQTPYVCGGVGPGKYLTSCEKFDGKWSLIKDLPTPLTGHCMIGMEDFVYVIGGSNGQVVSEHFDVFLHSTNLYFLFYLNILNSYFHFKL